MSVHRENLHRFRCDVRRCLGEKRLDRFFLVPVLTRRNNSMDDPLAWRGGREMLTRVPSGFNRKDNRDEAVPSAVVSGGKPCVPPSSRLTSGSFNSARSNRRHSISAREKRVVRLTFIRRGRSRCFLSEEILRGVEKSRGRLSPTQTRERERENA